MDKLQGSMAVSGPPSQRTNAIRHPSTPLPPSSLPPFLLLKQLLQRCCKERRPELKWIHSNISGFGVNQVSFFFQWPVADTPSDWHVSL